MREHDETEHDEVAEDVERHERCPICERVNAPFDDDVCEHFVCMLWDEETLEGDDAWDEAWKDAVAAIDEMESDDDEAVMERLRSLVDARALQGVLDYDSVWWLGEAEVTTWPVADHPASGLTRSVYHEDAAWFATVAERLRALAREAARVVGDPEEIRKGRESLDASWQSALAAQAARRATLHRTKSGEVLLSHDHVILLHALYDRPGGVAASSRDWERAALPYASVFGLRASEWAIRRSTRTISEALVERRQCGRCKEAVLTETGRGIVERTVPAHVRGHGAYEGLTRRGRGGAR